jgi:outer membrane protein TolC
MKHVVLILFLAGWAVWLPVMAQESEPQAVPDQLTWTDCVNLTLQHNVDLRQAETQLEEAEGAKLEFRSRVLPQAKLTALTFPPLVLLDVQQMIFDQRAILAWQASKLAGSVSRLNYELRLNETMMALRVSYLTVLLVQEQEKQARELQEFLQARRENAQSMFETGSLRKSELEQVEVRLNLINDAIVVLLDQKNKAQASLLEVMGTGVVMGQVDGAFEVLPARPVDREKITQAGLTGMPEVRLLEKLIEAGDYQVRIARAERYPNVYFYARAEFSPGADEILGTENRTENTATSAVGAAGAAAGALTGAGTGTSGTSTNVDPTTDTTGFGEVNSNQVGSDDDDEFEKSRGLFGVQLRWQALDGGKSEGKAMVQQAGRNTSAVNLIQLKQAIPGQVEEAAKEMETVRKILDLNREQLSFSETLKMAQSEYEGGRASQNETLAFALDSFQLNSQIIQEQYRASVAMTILRRISGQLLAFTENSGN